MNYKKEMQEIEKELREKTKENYELICVATNIMIVAAERLSVVEFFALIGSSLDALAIAKNMGKERISKNVKELLKTQTKIWDEIGDPREGAKNCD